MELRQLKAFLEVATQGHFGRAAARMSLTQPALTQRIQALERELGVHVFERTAREVRLTGAGRLLMPYARSMVEIEEVAMRRLKAHAAGLAGRLRIAYLSAGDVALPGRIVAEFRHRYPGVDLETSSGLTSSNLEQLADNEVDAAFITLGGALPDGLATRWISRNALVLALPSGHRLADMDHVPVRALVGEPIVMTPRAVNPTLVMAVEQWFATHLGQRLNIVAYEPADQAVEAVAQSDSVLTIVNERRAQSAPASGVVYRQLSPSPLLEFAIAYHGDDPSPELANLLQIADELAYLERGPIPPDSEVVIGGKPSSDRGR